MYFAIAYELWPHLTGRALGSLRLVKAQLWLWFIGMIVTTFPWHYVGILGMPRRMAYYDYSDPALAPQAAWVIMSVVGALILVASAVLFFVVLLRSHCGVKVKPAEFAFSSAVHEPKTLPVALNSFGLWIALMIGLTVVNYGYPIAQLMSLKQPSVPAIYMGAQR